MSAQPVGAPPATQVVVGRQGIYDRSRRVVAYELLFRGLSDGSARTVDGDRMTAEVLYGALTLGFDHLTDGRTAFCNADRGLLLGHVPLTLPPEHTVIEVLESVELDDEVIAGCGRLVELGYSLAADDFVWRPGAERLLPMTSVVKIDVLDTPWPEVLELVARCRQYDVRMLAEKVEDAAAVERCERAGFELFQGYALERPRVLAGATVEPTQLSRLNRATSLLGGELDLEQIEQVVRFDPGLALQVIRLASMGRPGETRHRVGSLHEALVLAGSRRVQNWVALLLARPRGTGDPARFTSTLIRARACELLAAGIDRSLGSLGFAAGMLSAVDVLLQVPPEQAQASLPLSDELREAAFGATSPVGRVVRDAIDYQLGKSHPVRRSGLDDLALHAAFGSAFAWAMSSTAALGEVDRAGGSAAR